MIVYFISALAVSAVIGALIGHFVKQRARAGAVIGFLLGPIGWLAIFALDDGQRLCSQCLGRVPLDARICRHCRSELPPEPASPEISMFPQVLRVVGSCLFVTTLIMAELYKLRPNATDHVAGQIAVFGFVPSAIAFGCAFFATELELKKGRRR